MADWMSIRNQATRTEVRGREPGGELAAPGELLGSIYIPWRQGLVNEGDYIYVAGVENGELMVICRVCAEAVARSENADHEVDVEARPGTEAPVVFDRFLDPEEADRIEILDSGGKTGHIKRGADGDIVGGQFQGRASIRELVGRSAGILDRVIGPR